MSQLHTHVRIGLVYITRQTIGTIYRAMPASGTSETYHQIGETTLAVYRHRTVDHLARLVDKVFDIAFCLKKIYHLAIAARQLLTSRVCPGDCNRNSPLSQSTYRQAQPAGNAV